ncbi:MAG: hypothetical protein KF872_12435 [Chitinophagales bacterium]|nr:hypothetical protein [Chitinophagales bacterium]
MNNFLKILSKYPAVTLRFLFSLVFIGIGLAIIYVPSITNGADTNTRVLFGALMLIYGSYRFLTFWWEYQKAKKGELL